LAKRKKDTHIIQSLDKGLHLLEMIEMAREPLSLNDLYKKLKWERASIHRMLETLVRRGYLIRDTKRKTYILGPKIYGLYSSIQRDLDIKKTIKPYLDELAKRTCETAHVAVAINNEMVFLDRSAGTEAVTVNTQIGDRVPLYCTAIGKAYLAFEKKFSLRDLYKEPLESYTTNTMTDIGAIEKDLELTQRRGYSFDNEEYLEGIRCVSAPIFNDCGEIVAVLGISGPKYRMTRNISRVKGKTTHEIAVRASKHFGYNEEYTNESNDT